MASTFTLDTLNLDGGGYYDDESDGKVYRRYLKLTCTQTPDFANNRSRIDWKLESIGGAPKKDESITRYSTGPTTVIIAGETVYYSGRINFSTGKFPAAVGSISSSDDANDGYKPVYIDHNTNGKAPAITCSISTNILTGKTPVSTSRTWSLDSISRSATLTNYPKNFNDDATEEQLSITCSNPAGSDVSAIDVCISFDRGIDIDYRTVTLSSDKKTGSATFDLTDDERQKLWEKAANSKSMPVYFILRTTINGVYYYDRQPATLNIVNAAPTIDEHLLEDMQASDHMWLTDDSEMPIRYISDARFTVKVSPQKSATLKTITIVNSGKTYKYDCENTSEQYTAVCDVSAIATTDFKITIVDSRGTSTETIWCSILEYVKPTCNIGHNRPDASGNFDLAVAGNFFNHQWPAGEYNCDYLYLRYRYKPFGTAWSSDDEGWSRMTITHPDPSSGDTYTAQASIKGLNYQSSYVFQVQVSDAAIELPPQEFTIQTSPIFDWGASDFQFNVPVYIKDSPDPNAPAHKVRVTKCVNRNKNNSGSNPWFKVASLKLPATRAYESRASFKVTHGYSTATAYGILDTHIRVNKVTTDGVDHYNIANTSFTFESGHKINPEDFVLAYDNPVDTTSVEIWVYLPAWYCCHFEVFSESSTSTFLYDEWTLHNTDSKDGYAPNVKVGYNPSASTDTTPTDVEVHVSAMPGGGLLAYPIGSVYISFDATSPASLFGGSWTRINNRFLWGGDQIAIDNNKLGNVGGSQNVTLTIDQIPAHTHGAVYSGNATPDPDTGLYYAYLASSSTKKDMAYNTISTGGGKSHTNMPPYIIVTIWRRTA